MAHYIVGDVHGCINELRHLLEAVAFQPGRDKLWSVGDLVGRGPHSKQVLEFVVELGESFGCVLGNHDLHLLSVLHGLKPVNPNDFTDAIITSSERDFWIDWLRSQPLMVSLPGHDTVISHAGLYPEWTITAAQTYAAEVESILRGDNYVEYLRNMYHIHPTGWHQVNDKFERFRFIVNAFTRMRYCHRDNDDKLHLDLTCKLHPRHADPEIQPWFKFLPALPITWVFGHWAALHGETERTDIVGLDTGCVWGNSLTLMRCSDHRVFLQPALAR